MGVLDRLKGLLGNTADDEVIVEAPVDREARRIQLNELEQALRELARSMAAETELMANPGWRGRVDDLRFAANEAAHVSSTEFDRTALYDIAAEVRPLYGSGDVPPEYLPYQAEHERVISAAAALRAPLDSESTAG